MNIKVETFPKYRIAYVRQVGPYGTANIEAMKKLKEWAEAKNLLADSAIILGIPQDNPETTLPENCRYDVCIVISKDYQMDNSVCEGELSDGKYAIYKVNILWRIFKKHGLKFFQLYTTVDIKLTTNRF